MGVWCINSKNCISFLFLCLSINPDRFILRGVSVPPQRINNQKTKAGKRSDLHVFTVHVNQNSIGSKHFAFNLVFSFLNKCSSHFLLG